MRIYFLTRQPDVCQLIADRLTKLKVEIKIYPIISSLLRDVFDFGLDPDILFLDYMYYNNERLNPYSVLKKHGHLFPIVFYNHPFPLPESRKKFWVLNLKRTGLFTDLSKIDGVLDIVKNALDDPDIYPYVSGIQQPESYHSTNLRYIVPLNNDEAEYYKNHFSNVITDYICSDKKGSYSKDASKKNKLKAKLHVQSKIQIPDFVRQFQLKQHLSHKLVLLFSYMYSKLNMHVPAEELCNVLSNDGEHLSPNGLRLSIHRLRNILEMTKSPYLELISFNYGYMLIDREKK